MITRGPRRAVAEVSHANAVDQQIHFLDDDVEIDDVVSKYLNKDMTAEEAMNRLSVYYLNLINSGRG